MARKVLGSVWDRTNRNNLNGMLEELYDNIFLFRDGTGFVLNHHLADDSIGVSKLRDGAVGNSKLAYRAVTPDKIAHGSVGGLHLVEGSVNHSKISTDSIGVNKSKDAPLVLVGKEGFPDSTSERYKNAILEAKVSGAERDRVYQLDSIRDGFNNTNGITVTSYQRKTDGTLDISTARTEMNYYGDYDVFQRGDIKTMIAHSNVSPGLSVSVTFGSSDVSGILNLSENELGTAHGYVIDPIRYNFKNVEEKDVFTDNITVEKDEFNIKVFVPSNSDYTCYHIKRVTKPFSPDDRGSNIDLWSLARVSKYRKNGEEFNEIPGRVFLHGDSLTQDTIFQLQGETDYSGGMYHGDEILESYKIIVGNADLTSDNHVGRYTGKTVEIIQETKLYEDTFNSSTGITDEYLKVNKAHIFDLIDGYTLRHKVETLKPITTTLSTLGAFNMLRVMGDGTKNNWTDIIDLTNMKSVNIRVPDSDGNHFEGTGAKQFKAIGYYKQCIITYESDNDFFDTWVRNWSDFDTKMYSRVFPSGEEIPAGEVVKASVNYKFS